jgi:hypothetical protein
LKEQKLGDADDALKHARLLADLVVGAFFTHEKDKDREKERAKRVDAFAAWKKSGETEVPEQLAAWQRERRNPAPPEGEAEPERHAVPAFHWMLEFPEVFYAERPDPLDVDQVNRAAYMDAFIGNPPYRGGLLVSGTFGNGYMAWLKDVVPTNSGKADLAAAFLLRAAALLGPNGTLGLVTTSTIGQGDTREAGLAALLGRGATIFCATRKLCN